MSDLITRAAAILDDPLILDWALAHYEHLPESARDSRARIEATWFHDLFLAQLFEQAETDTLFRVFRYLPPRHFANLTPLIVKHWADWPDRVACWAVEPLAVNAPDELLRLFETALERAEQGNPLATERFLQVRHLANCGTEERRRQFFGRLCLRTLALPDRDIGKSLLLGTMLGMARSLSTDTVVRVLDTALREETREHAQEAILKQLFAGLFGHAEYLDLALARSKKHSLQRFAALAPFFGADAPLAKLDEWCDALPAQATLLAALEAASATSEGSARLRMLFQNCPALRDVVPGPMQSLVLLAACVQGYASDTLDSAALDLETTANLLAADLVTARWYRPLYDRLGAFDRSDIVAALTKRLPDVAHTYGAVQLAAAMGDLGWEEFVPGLIAAMGDDKVDFLCEAAAKALAELGPPAQAALIAGWAELDRSQRIYGLTVIGQVGGAAAADFTCAHFDALMKDDVEHCCELCLATPDQRLLECLRPELRRKQALIDRAFYILARLLDREDEDSASAKVRALEDLKHQQNIGNALGAGALPRDSLSLELRCPSCQAENRYQVKGVIMTFDKSEGATHLVNDEFPCASCGESVEFEFTSMAHLALTAEALRMKVEQQSGQPRQPLIKSLDCRVDGQVMSLAAGLQRLRDRIHRMPTDAQAWFQLGNLLFHLNRPQATLAAFRQAVKAAPLAIDAKLTLARLLALNQAYDEAFELLSGALKRASDWQFLAPYPQFAQAFADLYNHIRRSLGKNELPALHPSSLAVSKKPGRNDPCSCGSGKKFKRCCGR